MTDLLRTVAILAMETIAFIMFYSVSVVMIIGVFTIAVLNIPDEILSDYPDFGSVTVVVMLIAAPQLILAQSIAWWYNQYQQWRRYFIEVFGNGTKSD